MKKLNFNQLQNVQGGQCNIECSFQTPGFARFIFLICDAPQLNGWLVASGSGVLECHEVG